MQTVRESVAQKIRLLREVRGLSQQEMALRLKMTQGGYGKIERAESDLTLSRLTQILQEFGLNLQDFFSLDLSPLGGQLPVEAVSQSAVEHHTGSTNNHSIHNQPLSHSTGLAHSAFRLEHNGQGRVSDDQIRVIALQRENELLREIIHLLRGHEGKPEHDTPFMDK